VQVRLLAASAVAALLFASGVQAADAPAEASSNGILVYDQAFFASARPNTAYDMIKRVPGFTFDAGATARGFAGTAGNVLINGQRPTSKSETLDATLQRIPASDVDHLELIRGGAPGIDMQGLPVIVNVVRKSADSTQIVATLDDIIFVDGHQIPNGSLEFTQHSNGTTYELSTAAIANYDDSVGKGYHTTYDGLGNLLTRDITHSHGMGIGWNVKGAITTPLFGGEFKVNGLIQSNPFVDSLSYERPGFFQLFRDNSRSNRQELGLHWQGNVGIGELETLVLQTLRRYPTRSTADDGTTFQDFRSLSDTGETIARATLRVPVMPELNLEAGAEGAFNYLNGRTSFAVNGAAVPLPDANAYVDEERGEVFAQGTWKPSSEWMLEAGIRAEYSNINESSSGTHKSRTFFYPKPRAVLTWSPLPDTQVRLRYEKIVGQLDFNNFIATANLSSTGVTAGNNDLRPDQRQQFAVTFEQHFWGKGAAVLTFMHEQITDVVDLVPVSDGAGGFFDAPGNIGDGTNEELKFNLTLPLDKIGIPNGLITATHVFDWSEVTDPVTHTTRVISGQRPNNINIKFSQDIDAWQSTYGIYYYNCWDEEYYRLQQVQFRHIAAPYVGVFWDYKPSEDWSFHFEANNLWAFVYTDTRFNYAGPRDTFPVDNIDRNAAQSRPYVEFTLRHTF